LQLLCSILFSGADWVAVIAEALMHAMVSQPVAQPVWCLLLLVLQVAKQQGEYLAEVLKRGSFDQQAGVLQPSEKQEPFK
jgi:hypothetical protein